MSKRGKGSALPADPSREGEAVREYVTITSGLRGYFVVHIVDGEPWQTGAGSYRTADAAVPEGLSYARAEGIPFRR